MSQKGTIFYHNETKKPALWITPYNANWLSKEDPNLHRIRSCDDIPDFDFELHDVGMPPEIYKLQGKNGLYRYLQAFFSWSHKREKAEILAMQDDFWLFVLTSGFPKEKEITA